MLKLNSKSYKIIGISGVIIVIGVIIGFLIVRASPDSVTDTFENEDKISTTTQVVVSGGQVKLAEKTWYDIYGPDGTGDVVQIGEMYVARNTNTAGTANNGTKDYDGAAAWAAGLNWLGKTDWRMPTKYDNDDIYTAKDSLGSYEPSSYGSSSTCFSETMWWQKNFDTGSTWFDDVDQKHYVRAVRNVQ